MLKRSVGLLVVFLLCLLTVFSPGVLAQDAITFSGSADVVTLDPQDMTDNTSEMVTRMIYDNLIDFDEELNLVPGLAVDWETSEDERTWTFYLRQGVEYQDGTKFDAQAVKASFDRILDADNNLKRRPLYNMIDKVEIVDEYIIDITTNEPFGAFAASLAHGAGAIVNPSYIELYGNDLGDTAAATSGTGPYKVVEWRKDEVLVLERNDRYWGEEPPTNRIEYRPLPEASSRIVALETGEVDVISHIPSREIERLQENEETTIHKTVSVGQRQFRFHCAKEPFTDARVRKAIAYAIDKEAITENIMGETAQPSTSALAPQTWGYVNLGTIPYDPSKARELLAEAGYPDGFETTISTTARYEAGVEVTEAVAHYLNAVGIKADIDVLEWSTIVSQWSGLKPEENPQEIFIMGAGPSTGDADWGLRPIFKSAPTNENNYGYYSNEEFDQVITEAMETTDPEKRKELYKRAQEIVYLEDPGAVWIYDTNYLIAARSNVKDLTLSPLGLITFEKAYKE